MTEEQAKQLKQNTEDINKIKEDMLSEETLTEKVEEALTTAKESGEFNGPAGADGYTPVKGTDYWTEEDKAEINEELSKNLTLGVHTDGLVYVFVNGQPQGNGVEFIGNSGDVTGYVDSENNIVLTGNLPDGTYTFNFVMEDGSLIEIGEKTISNSNGDEEDEPSEPKGNLADPTSADWLTDSRLATGYGYAKTLEGCVFTNYIPAKVGDILRVKGLNLYGAVGTNQATIGMYSSTDTAADSTGRINAYIGFVATSIGSSTSGDGVKQDVSVDGDVHAYTMVIKDGAQLPSHASTAYIRISAPLMDGYTADDVIITINEEIE